MRLPLWNAHSNRGRKLELFRWKAENSGGLPHPGRGSTPCPSVLSLFPRSVNIPLEGPEMALESFERKKRYLTMG